MGVVAIAISQRRVIDQSRFVRLARKPQLRAGSKGRWKCGGGGFQGEGGGFLWSGANCATVETARAAIRSGSAAKRLRRRPRRPKRRTFWWPSAPRMAPMTSNLTASLRPTAACNSGIGIDSDTL
jgi:hypothetical protein